MAGFCHRPPKPDDREGRTDDQRRPAAQFPRGRSRDAAGGRPMARRILALLAAAGLLILGAAPAGAANLNSQNSYTVTNLQSDVMGRAADTDSDLVNGWGITAGPTTPWWVADNGTHK